MLRDGTAGAPPIGDTVLSKLAEPFVSKVAVLAAFAILVVLAFTRNVNWDEFYFLSHVHAHLDGRLDRPLQTAFVHAFGWLNIIPGHEMAQIATGRLVMTGFLAVTCLSIFHMAHALAGNRAAWIAVATFLASGFTLAHGASFRADPMAAAGLMASLAIMLNSRMAFGHIIAVAALSAAALLVTIKSGLFLPAYLGVLAWRMREPQIALRILAAGVLGVALAAAGFMLHASGINTTSDTSAAGNMTNALGVTLLESGLLPRGEEALLWVLLSVGAFALAWFGITRSETRQMWLLFSFVAPMILSILFYRNAFVYFFPFIAAPAMVAVAVGAARLGAGQALGALMALILATGAGQAIRAASEGSELQRATLAEVHRLFPQPVAYIDHNAMISSFPRKGFFMSTWGMINYRSEGRLVMADLLADTQPPLLLANRWALHQAMTSTEIVDNAFSLLPEDQTTLREAYVHYSGAIWLAGRKIQLSPEPTEIILPIDGSYQIRSNAPLLVDGTKMQDGDVIEVSGLLQLAAITASTEVTFIWYSGQELAPAMLPQTNLYVGFWGL